MKRGDHRKYIAIGTVVCLLIAAGIFGRREFLSTEEPLQSASSVADQDASVRNDSSPPPSVATSRDTASTVSNTTAPETTIWEQFGSVEWWRMLDEHWAKALEGDANSLLASYKILSTCRPYRRRFEGKDISEVHAEFAHANDPALFELNEKFWKHCGPIYQNWEAFDGWQAMHGLAAEKGQPVAMVEQAAALVRDRETVASGVDMIVAALNEPDAYAVATMTDVLDLAGFEDSAAYAWLLASCELGLDCSPGGNFMQASCGPYSQTCGIDESVDDYALRVLGDHGYQLAREEAKQVANAIASGKIAELDLPSRFEEALESKSRTER